MLNRIGLKRRPSSSRDLNFLNSSLMKKRRNLKKTESLMILFWRVCRHKIVNLWLDVKNSSRELTTWKTNSLKKESRPKSNIMIQEDDWLVTSRKWRRNSMNLNWITNLKMEIRSRKIRVWESSLMKLLISKRDIWCSLKKWSQEVCPLTRGRRMSLRSER